MFWLFGLDFEFADTLIFRRAFHVDDLHHDESAGLTAGHRLFVTRWDADAALLRAHNVIEPMTALESPRSRVGGLVWRRVAVEENGRAACRAGVWQYM